MVDECAMHLEDVVKVGVAMEGSDRERVSTREKGVPCRSKDGSDEAS